MITCEKCGAESDGDTTCPRCGSPFPSDRNAKPLAIASAVFGIACCLCASIGLFVDYRLNGEFGWSFIGLASSAAGWILVGFPMLVYRKPRLFLPVMGAAAIVYLWVLDGLTGASGWFLSLALPIALAAMACAALSTLLCLKASRRGPNVGAFVLFGCTLACLSVEAILSMHFDGVLSISWSAIVAASALSLAFLLLGIQSRLRQPGVQAPLANPSSK